MLEISEISCSLTEGASERGCIAACTRETTRLLGCRRQDLSRVALHRKSIDARKKSNVHFTLSARIDVASGIDELRLLEHVPPRDARRVRAVDGAEPSFERPRNAAIAPDADERPIVVGAGCAGLFAALTLAEAGLAPLLIEQGDDATRRTSAVRHFNATGELDPASNIQFGLGGAGTFSDGKLNTGTKDLRHGYILEEFVRFGASEDILVDAKPHVGTDKLYVVLQNLRREIIDRGGEVRFSHAVVDIEQNSGSVTALRVSAPEGEYTLPTKHVVLAPGHSARDTFEMLQKRGVPMEPKPFAVGVRIEHRQRDMDLAQYKEAAGRYGLPPTSYKLSCHTEKGRGVFSFCVCPGGEVVAAASEEKRVVTNGMSEFARDGENINGGLLVSVMPEDFPSGDTLAGVQFQRELEDAAYRLGGGNYAAPAQRVEDFLKHRPSTGAGKVVPTYLPSVRWCDLHGCLPPFVCEALEEGLPMLGRKLRGFDAPDAVLTAVETRSSSPVRIVRDNLSFQSALRGLYPCGEGAGYAGGIMSAAADGLRVAEMILEELNHE